MKIQRRKQHKISRNRRKRINEKLSIFKSGTENVKNQKENANSFKKIYNDEAEYDFSTLDDIYEAMTPALNKYGVNFDIVREIPTQYDKEGHPTYLVLDKDDFWRYEADVELSWTNADRPEECRHATIHITGTNEIPDKAHGTALTYGLKYYFRNKFCIRQVGSEQEDPDYTKHDVEQDTNAADRPAKETHKREKETNKAVKSSESKKGTAEDKKNPAVSSGKSKEMKTLLGNTPVTRVTEKTEKDTAVWEKQAEHVTKSEEKKEVATSEGGEKLHTEEAALADKPEDADGFIPVNAEEVPFEEDADFMEELQGELEEETSDSEVEAAKKFVCDFGVFKGKTMEQVLEAGVKGTETLKWIANKYKGPNKELVKAAKTLLDYQSESEELKAA